MARHDELHVDAACRRRGLSIGKVSKAQFDDYVSVDGSVVPIQVVQISSEEGGVVLEKVKEEAHT